MNTPTPGQESKRPMYKCPSCGRELEVSKGGYQGPCLPCTMVAPNMPIPAKVQDIIDRITEKWEAMPNPHGSSVIDSALEEFYREIIAL